MPARIVVYTDLDGTLLDHDTYSAGAAEEALVELERRRVPVVLVTSKTRAEVDVVRRTLGNKEPFVTENGGGVFIPQEYFNKKIEGETRIGRYHVLALGRPYEEVADALEEIAAEARAEVVGFRQMSAREIAQNTGLSVEEAELAKRRDFDEPFFFAGGGVKAEKKLGDAARARGMEIARGGRFWHLFAGSDKGKAVKKLMGLFRNHKRDRLRAIGIGDSANDLAMLKVVDVAVLLPGADGSFDAEVLEKLPRVKRGPAAGPVGWNEVMLEMLRQV